MATFFEISLSDKITAVYDAEHGSAVIAVQYGMVIEDLYSLPGIQILFFNGHKRRNRTSQVTPIVVCDTETEASVNVKENVK